MVGQARKHTAVERSTELQKLRLLGQLQRHCSKFSDHDFDSRCVRKSAGGGDLL